MRNKPFDAKQEGEYAMEIKLFGEYVNFHDNLKTEISIYNHFVRFANQFSTEYEEFYYTCSGVTEVLSGSENFARNRFDIICEKIVSILAANNIFGISSSQLYKYHQGFHIFSALNDLRNSIDKLREQRDQEIAYRSYRKATRDRFVGGGFGVSGAIKGITMAGTANLATGAIHSVANAFGNMGSSSRYNRRMTSLHNSSKCSVLRDAMYKDCLEFYNVLEKCFSDNGFRTGNIGEKIKKADIIYDQINNKKLPESAINGALISMISTFPGKEDYYCLARRVSSEPCENLISCMEYFELDTSEFMMVDASCIWRKAVFGEYEAQIENKKDEYGFANPYVSDFFLPIVPYLEFGSSLSEYIEESIKSLNSFSSISANYFYPLVNGKNGNIYMEVVALFNVNISRDEIPLLLICVESPLLSEIREKKWILITSNKFYYCRAKENSEVHICDIQKISVYKDSLYLNGKEFSRSIYLMSENNQIEFQEYLWALIVLLQCLHTVELGDRQIALLTKSNCENYHRDIRQFFENDIALTFSTDNDIQKFVNMLCEKAHIITPNKVQKIIDKNLKSSVDSLELGEFLIYCVEGGLNCYIMFTNQKIRYRAKKQLEESIPLANVNNIFYSEEKDYFVINGSIKVNIGYYKKEGIDFCNFFMYLKRILIQYNQTLLNQKQLTECLATSEVANAQIVETSHLEEETVQIMHDRDTETIQGGETISQKSEDEVIVDSNTERQKLEQLAATLRVKAEAEEKARLENERLQKEAEAMREKAEAEEKARIEAERIRKEEQLRKKTELKRR